MNNQNMIETVTRISGVNPRKCMRCGKCSASCPAYDEMEYHPHQFVSMVENGRIDELLSSKGIYTCLSCFACVERCPRNVEPAKLIEAVRLRGHPPAGHEPSRARAASRSCSTTSCRSRPSPARSANTESKEGTKCRESAYSSAGAAANIAATVDVERVAETLGHEPGVVFATHYPYMCSQTGQDMIRRRSRNTR